VPFRSKDKTRHDDANKFSIFYNISFHQRSKSGREGKKAISHMFRQVIVNIISLFDVERLGATSRGCVGA
jgi:hypothetical protein